MQIIGIHLDLNGQHYRFEHYLNFLDLIADWGYNSLLLEYGDMFPYKKHSEFLHKDHWTLDQVRCFNLKAKRRHIEVIPLVQTVGHLGVVLRHKKYRDLCEYPEEQGGFIESICPMNPQAVELVKDLCADVIAAHPDSRYIHLGGDEALMGVCPRCKDKIKQIGKSRHYINHMNPLIEEVLDAKKRPIIWADMLEHHPEALKVLNHKVILCDWNFDSRNLSQQWVFIRAGEWSSLITNLSIDELPPSEDGGSQLYWAARGSWSPTVTRHSLNKMPAQLRHQLSKYWSYQINDYPEHFHGFPYIRYLQDKGFDVMFAPAIKSSGDSTCCVRYQLHIDNCLSAAEAVAQAGAMGVITTSWSSHLTPLENQYLGMFIASRAYAHPGKIDPVVEATRYEKKQFGKTFGLLDVYRELGECTHLLNMNYCRYLKNSIAPLSLDKQLKLVKGDPNLTLHRVDKALHCIRSVNIRHREIDVLYYAARELGYKARLVLSCRNWIEDNRMVNLRTVRRELEKVKTLFRQTFSNYLTDWSLNNELQFRFGADEKWIEKHL